MATERIDIVVTEKGAKQVQRSIVSLGGSSERAGAGVAALTRALAGVASVLSIRKIILYADAWTRVNSQVKVALNGQGDLRQSVQDVFDIAQKMRQPLEALTKLYARTTLAAHALGVSQGEVRDFTEGVASALLINASSGHEARGALIQLAQAIGAGTVRAEEFNAVLEGARPVLVAVADGLVEAGGSVAKLRQLVIDGKVPSEKFFRAFQYGAIKLREQMKNVTFTVAQNLQKIENSFTRFIGELNEATGISRDFGEAVADVAEYIDSLDAQLISVEIQQWFRQWSVLFSGVGDGFSSLSENASRFFDDTFSAIPGFLAKAFRDMPANIRFIVKAMGIEFGHLVSGISLRFRRTKEIFSAVVELFAASFNSIKTKIINGFREVELVAIKARLKVLQGQDLLGFDRTNEIAADKARIASIQKTIDMDALAADKRAAAANDELVNITKKFDAIRKGQNKAREDSLQAVADERQATLSARDAITDAEDKASKERARQKAIRLAKEEEERKKREAKTLAEGPVSLKDDQGNILSAEASKLVAKQRFEALKLERQLRRLREPITDQASALRDILGIQDNLVKLNDEIASGKRKILDEELDYVRAGAARLDQLEREIAIQEHINKLKSETPEGKIGSILGTRDANIELIKNNVTEQQAQIRLIEQEHRKANDAIFSGIVSREEQIRQEIEDTQRYVQILRDKDVVISEKTNQAILARQRDLQRQLIEARIQSGSAGLSDVLFGTDALSRLFQDFENIGDNFKALIAQMIAEAAALKAFDLFGLIDIDSVGQVGSGLGQGLLNSLGAGVSQGETKDPLAGTATALTAAAATVGQSGTALTAASTGALTSSAAGITASAIAGEVAATAAATTTTATLSTAAAALTAAAAALSGAATVLASSGAASAGGSALSGAAGAALGSVAAFRTGGQFTVGGTGGPDSQLVAFRASPNERVTIETPNQQRDTKRETEVAPQANVFNFNVKTSEGGSFKKTRRSMVSDFERSLTFRGR